jgi:uncharacterized membrane protein YoaK (UPF0700 family)
MNRHSVITPIAIALAFGSGALDVANFTRLGGVFASVMTGNIVLAGLAIARGSVSLLLHSLCAIAGYVVGVAAGTRIAWFHSPEAAGSPTEKASWAPHVRVALSLELVLLCGVTAGWFASDARPLGALQFSLLALAAAAMGVQSAAADQMGLKGVSTTYLTGTLTGLVVSLARPGRKREGVLRPGLLLGLLTGALLSGLLVRTAPILAPLLPVGALVLVLVLGITRESAG